MPQAFDSLIGKLIVTGASRAQALERARRALAEFTVGGMPTVLPFHRAVVNDPAFAGDHLEVHTRWIETEMAATFEPQLSGPAAEAAGARGDYRGGRREKARGGGAGGAVGGRRPASTAGRPAPAERGRASRGSARRPGGQRGAAGGDSLVTPMQGTIVKIVAAEGSRVAAGDTVVILEAMKMEQPLTAHKAGTVTGLAVEVGQTVAADTEICQIKD